MATNYNINLVYNLLLFEVRKERGLFVSISEAMNTIDLAQMEKFEEDFKLYKINQTIADSLSVFKVTNLQFSATGGVLTFPSNYMHFLDDIFTVTGSTVNKATQFNEDEKADALTNQLRTISTSNPYYENTSGGIQLYPQTTQIGFYSYLRRPNTPVLAYTQVGRAITYDSAGSTQLEWQDNYIPNIISRALAYWGIYMDEDKIVQFSQLKQQQTEA
jgi:hypothetical protein